MEVEVRGLLVGEVLVEGALADVCVPGDVADRRGGVALLRGGRREALDHLPALHGGEGVAAAFQDRVGHFRIVPACTVSKRSVTVFVLVSTDEGEAWQIGRHSSARSRAAGSLRWAARLRLPARSAG